MRNYEGHPDYQKFIILGKARSGSNYLRGLLNSQRNIILYGELFREYDSIGWDLPKLAKDLQSPLLISLMQRHPIDFLEKYLFRKYDPEISAVGFKLFYYHAQNDSRKVLWPYIKEQKNIKIIHIQRKNTLRELLSLNKAFKSNVWTNTDGKDEQTFAINLDYDDCLHEFTYAQQIKAEFTSFFQDHPSLNVFYENLSDDYRIEIKRINDFLDVAYEPAEPSTFKQANQSLKEAISNYYELKERFISTSWECFFED